MKKIISLCLVALVLSGAGTIMVSAGKKCGSCTSSCDKGSCNKQGKSCRSCR